MSDALLDFAQRVRDLKKVPVDVAPRVADVVRRYLNGTIAAGTDADRRKWAPSKKGDANVLTNAAASLSVRAIGPVIVSRVTGRHVFHDLGIANGAPRRGILPDATMPAELARQIDEAIGQEVTRALTQ